jgi:MoaA/NifB/PqqE/SkfB family radical SAM enzyme
MLSQSLYHTYKRYRTLQTDKITALPIVILMPHSACNCRCAMCDIWKDNHNLKQLNEDDLRGLLATFRKFDTKQVLMSGGEALLHPNFFRFCEILKNESIKVSLLSTGLTLKKHARQLTDWVNDIIVSLDGDEPTHNEIRHIPDAFNKLKDGVEAVKSLKQSFKITGRSVIHRLNFQKWPLIISSAKGIGLDQVSFLPADVSSHAFNREVLWSDKRRHEIMLEKEELPELKRVIESVVKDFSSEFETGFIAESPRKIEMIYDYYAAFYGLTGFPYKKCNAPWVSTVVEADGTVRPCFFHPAIGNIHDNHLDEILNSNRAVEFRKSLDIDNNDVCEKCVCYLNLPPGTNPVREN